jgi:spoIIIJ-associated protein
VSEDESALPALVEVEAEGETVGEAKWLGLRELERRCPGLDREQVAFEVLSEGERGLLGVGMTPARVVARFDPSTAAPARPTVREVVSDRESLVREVLEEIAHALGAECRVQIRDEGDSLSAMLSGPDVAVLIGKHGKTIDSIQYVLNAALATAEGELATKVTVDAAQYRARRESRLTAVAIRSADRVIRTGQPVALEPMTSAERKIVHLHLKDVAGIETRSEGDEPHRHVVVVPAAPAERDSPDEG